MLLSLATARALRAAGLAWRPAQLDFFAIPDHGLDERVFVITDLPAALAQIQGQTMMTFEGAVEWAMDYIAAGEVVWLPSEAQLRELLAARLGADPAPRLSLTLSVAGCRCDLTHRGQALSFEGPNGAEAYAAALLHLLNSDS
jgi:hypothetical protein